MMHNDGKSKLMHLLEDIGKEHMECQSPSNIKEMFNSGTIDLIDLNVAVIDGMAEVQILSNATLKSIYVN